MNFAEQVRQAIAIAQEATEKKRLEELEIKKQEHNKENIKGIEIACKDFKEIKAKILEDAKSGKTFYLISIYEWNDSYSCTPYEIGYVDTMKGLLLQDGFKVEDRYSKNEPCGSDPLFYNTVYSYYLMVTW